MSKIPLNLPEKDRIKLIKILGALGSAFEGERASAALKADNLLRSFGLTWSDVINPISVTANSINYENARKYEISTPPSVTATEWRYAVSTCLLTIKQNAKINKVSDRDRSFLENIASYHPRAILTPKQVIWLEGIISKMIIANYKWYNHGS